MPEFDTRVESANLADGPLELEARDGESIRILGIGLAGTDADTTVHEYIREELMRAWQEDAGDESIVPVETLYDKHMDFFGALRDRGMNVPYLVVPEGRTYRMETDSETGTATVLYEEMGAGRVSGDEPGGPGNKTRTFVSAARETIDLTEEAGPRVELVDSAVQPAQLGTFPYAEDVPPNREYSLQALMLSASVDSEDTGASLDAFRLRTDETPFLARDADFVDARFAQYPSTDLDTMPMLFPDEPTFVPGEDLDLEVQVSGADDGTVVVDASMVFHRRSP